MAFAGVNYLAVLLAAIASYLFGALWYGLLSRPWMAAAGVDEAMIKGADRKGPPPWPFIVAFLAQLFMALMLAGLIGHLSPGRVTLRTGVISALAIWAGFVMTSMIVNHNFQMTRPALTAIDGGHWLGVLVLQGLVIGWMGL
jgi:hypothetical protein